MGGHYLLSSASRTFSISTIARMSENHAREVFRQARFPETSGNPYCIFCGSLKIYEMRTRKIWSCAYCGKRFSLTSGTIFANNKLSTRDYLLMLFYFANASHGISALQLSRAMNVQYKTAYMFCQKIRVAIEAAQQQIKLFGEVEIDGASFGGHWVVQNHSSDPGVKKRIRYPKKAHRCVVIVLRQRGGRTVTLVGKSEYVALSLIRSRVKFGTILYVDGSRAWSNFKDAFNLVRIEHATAYSLNGACTNQAESFFSRLRRAHQNHHRISNKYFKFYAAEIAWREDHRRISSGAQWLALLAICMNYSGR